MPHLPLGIKVGGEDQLQWVLVRNSLYNVQGGGCGCLIFFLLISFQKDHGDRNLTFLVRPEFINDFHP